MSALVLLSVARYPTWPVPFIEALLTLPVLGLKQTQGVFPKMTELWKFATEMRPQLDVSPVLLNQRVSLFRARTPRLMPRGAGS